MPVISSQPVEVDENVTGQFWTVDDIQELAKIIAIITLGQVEHAAEIIHSLDSSIPVKSKSELYEEARKQLLIKGENDTKKNVSRYHRDGFLFESMSWIVAQQTADENTYLKDPHIKSTTQGLDGLIIQMDPTEKILLYTTICEDKCTQNPRDKFRDEVLTTFVEHHQNKRGSELLANAVALIKQSGLKGTAATRAAEKVHDKTHRTYRAALTVSSVICNAEGLRRLFKGYDSLTEITKEQRIGATFIVSGNLREWFQELADHVIHALYQFEELEALNV